MRWLASGDTGPGWASVATTAGVSPVDARAPTAPLAVRARASAAAAALTKRLAGIRIEEVELRDVHGHRDLLGKPQLHVRREVRDEVWPDTSDSRPGLLDDVLVGMGALPDGVRVDMEIDH